MAFVQITAGQTDAGSPIDEDLMDTGVRLNLDDHESRIGTLEGGGGGGGAAGIEITERFTQIKKSLGDSVVDPNAKAIQNSFYSPEVVLKHRLMRDYPGSGTDAYVMANPLFLESGNPDFQQSTGAFAALGGTDASNLSAGTGLIGSDCPQWDKAGGSNTYSMIFRNVGTSNTIYVSGNRTVLMFLYAPSLTNLSQCVIRVSADTTMTNYAEYRVSTQQDGSAFVADYNILLFDLDATPDATGGTGWSVGDGITSFGGGVIVSSSGQTYTGLQLESLNFSQDTGVQVPDYKRLWLPGVAGVIADNSNHELFTPDYTTSAVVGKIALSAALSNSYTGGSSSTIRRNTLKTSEGDAQFNDDSELTSGTVENQQDVIDTVVLPASISGGGVDHSVEFYTDLVFEINDKPSATTFTATTVDRTAELKLGDKLRVYNVRYNNGKAFYEESATVTLTADSTFSSPDMTFTVSSGDNSSVSVDNVAIKQDEVQAYMSVHGFTANDSIGTALTPTERSVVDIGLPYPKASNVFGHYLRYGASEADSTGASKNRKSGSVGPDLTVNGTGAASFSREFLNGQLGAGTFTDANYLSIPYPQSEPLDPDSTRSGGGKIGVSGWIYVPSVGLSTPKNILTRNNGASGVNAGWHVQISAAEQLLLIINASNTRLTSATLNLGAWNHFVINLEDNVKTQLAVNKVLQTDAGSQNIAPINNPLYIGRYDAGGSAYADGYLSDFIFLSGDIFSESDISNLYAGGRHQVVGTQPGGFTYRFSETGTGQVITTRDELTRRANTHNSFIRKNVTVSLS